MSVYNCPNCGAPIDGHKCKYCGTVIFDFAQIKMGEPCWVALDAGDGIKRLAHVIMKSIEVVQNPYPRPNWIIDKDEVNIQVTQGFPETTLRIEFDCVPEMVETYKAAMMMFKDERWSD
jgi:hypothetical protein